MPGPQGWQGHPWANPEPPASTTNRRHSSLNPEAAAEPTWHPKEKRAQHGRGAHQLQPSWHPRSQGWAWIALAGGSWPPSTSTPNHCLQEPLCEHLLPTPLRLALCLKPCTLHPVGTAWSEHPGGPPPLGSGPSQHSGAWPSKHKLLPSKSRNTLKSLRHRVYLSFQEDH